MVFILNFNLENNNGCLPHLFIPKSILNLERFFFFGFLAEIASKK